MIADIVAVAVLLAGTASPTRQGFGTPAYAAYFDPTTHWQNSGDRIRFYPSASALTALVADGFTTGGHVYRAFEVALAQPQVPPLLALARRALPPTQILKAKLLDVTAGDRYTLTIIGTTNVATTYAWTSTGVPATDAATAAALFTALNIGTVTVSTDTISLTQVPGSLTDLQYWSPNLAISNATVDPGIAADLAAIKQANTLGWYGLSLDSNSLQEVEAAAAWVEATGQGGKWGFFDSADTANVNGVVTVPPCLNAALQAVSRNKCHLGQSNRQVLSCAGFALASLLLAKSPGSYNVAFKTLGGVIADDDSSMTETQQLTLNTASTSQPGTGGLNGNWFKTVSGLNITFPGVTPGGRWVDQGIMVDWIQNNVQADIFAVLAGQDIVPLTDIGLGQIGAAIKSRLKTGSKLPYGAIDGTRPIVVNVPRAADMSPTDRQNRNLSGISATFFWVGAVNTTTLTITGSP